MDPQQRLLLELGYASLHGAGERRAGLLGSDVAFFLGIERPDWALRTALAPAPASGGVSAYAATSDTISVANGRVSFVLGLQGPCASIDAACASGLVALHVASLTVGSGEISRALVSVVTLKLMPQPTLAAAANPPPTMQCRAALDDQIDST